MSFIRKYENSIHLTIKENKLRLIYSNANEFFQAKFKENQSNDLNLENN